MIFELPERICCCTCGECLSCNSLFLSSCKFEEPTLDSNVKPVALGKAEVAR
ncbi:hypothetical protein COLO4_25326 [Corchorus olitorius]|uniref:Uncharacterized protein n=1 Tax=Corchorus olitorius TaxID=93759 RepID=A0A1R3I3F9_9ROSI|nr:hypothetical protein COLO4_25326 [Corchorus olitorius]